jgi:hypothetical protein
MPTSVLSGMGIGRGIGGFRRARGDARMLLRRHPRRHIAYIALAFDLEAYQVGPDRQDLAYLATQRQDLAMDGRWHLHRGFVGHDVGEHLVLDHAVPGLYMPLDQLHFRYPFPDVRHFDQMRTHGQASSDPAWIPLPSMTFR